MIPTCVIDTDILSEVLKGRDDRVVDHADAYLAEHGAFTISAFTRFEVVRGLRWRAATEKLVAFDHLCQSMTILPVIADVLDRAAELWAFGATTGKPRTDGDPIIAATSLVHRCELVTGNTKHFEWIDGLTVTSWRD